MPANLTPQYLAADERFRTAKSCEEKIAALEEMMATIPRHKGTEKMQADIRRRLKKLREEGARKQSGKSQFSYHVEKEGAAQLVIVGAPNSGKSSLLCAVTNAVSEVADYPYTTRKVVPGMMKYQNVQIQLIDTPAISPEFMETWLAGIIRNADGVIVTVDLAADDVLEQLEMVISRLEECRIRLKGDVGSEIPGHVAEVRALVLGTKAESEGARENLEVLRELYASRFPVLAVAGDDPESLGALKKEIFTWLSICRVYTKTPGVKVDMEHPFIFKAGSTVIEVAEGIHKDLAEKFKYARIWGSERYEGQMVQKDYVLRDGDIIEIHAV